MGPGAVGLKFSAATVGDYGGQVLVWLATSGVFPVAVFYGFVLGGSTKEEQLGAGQLLLVASTLTAPIIGALISMPGRRTVGRSLLFFLAFVHVSVTVFYFAGALAEDADPGSIADNSIWLYVFALSIGISAVIIGARAFEDETQRRIDAALHGRSMK